AMSVLNTRERDQEIKLTVFNIGITPDAFDTDSRCITDADIATAYLCSKAALDVTLPVPEGTSEIIIVGNAACQVTGATQYSNGDHLRRYKIAPGAREVRITHPKKDFSFVNEVIFK
ncbi:MAG: hypothetical protein IJ956_05865, partial [Akkermansia sp.]|nr:hypothetical protein [Akkermansia sp.]